MLHDNLQESALFIRKSFDFEPEIGLITGTGLGESLLFDELLFELPYQKVPHLPIGAVSSHKQVIQFGIIAGKQVVVFSGRAHFYEGYPMSEVTYSTRLIETLGAKQLLLTNVSGSVQPHIKAGDLVVLCDHINLLPEHPLRGANDDRLGIRFPDMVAAYDPEYRKMALLSAQQAHWRCHEGVYLALQGPSLETPAEYRMIRLLGADVVGMSTVPEVIVARHCGLKVLALSVASNCAWPPDRIPSTTIEEVIEMAQLAAPKLAKVIADSIRLM